MHNKETNKGRSFLGYAFPFLRFGRPVDMIGHARPKNDQQIPIAD
jgi:hypothetical protein